jgi:hypothetical protein
MLIAKGLSTRGYEHTFDSAAKMVVTAPSLAASRHPLLKVEPLRLPIMCTAAKKAALDGISFPISSDM